MLDDLTWLYLESAVYTLELPKRPVLADLRRAHADYFFGIQYKLSRQEWMAKNQLVYTQCSTVTRSVLTIWVGRVRVIKAASRPSR